MSAAEQESPEGNRKLFVAGVSYRTTDDGFSNFFARLGDVESTTVMRDRAGNSRGFGFVIFKDEETAERVKKQSLTLDGRRLDLMTAVPRSEVTTPMGGSKMSGKLYIAGISFDADEAAVKSFFSRYGNVTDAKVMRDKMTNRSRGFGFVTFEDPSVAEKVSNMKLEWSNGRILDVKPAAPRGMVHRDEAKVAAGTPKENLCRWFAKEYHL